MALFAAAFYLLLSGAEVATQRSFYMIAIVLIGVVADRAALTMRTIAIAAVIVMVLAPEAVVHPSFQMSFAATLALVALYERGVSWGRGWSADTLGGRAALWGGREVVGLMLASLIAGCATMPYAAYHFHRLAPYGVIANLLAMPVVSAVVMPAGLLALIAMPFGLDAPLWGLMGEGIAWMNNVALWVAHLPGAVGRTEAFGTGALLLMTLGLILMCLLKTPLRWSGVAVLALGVVVAVCTPQPDILVSTDGHVVGVRRHDRLAIIRTGNDAFAIREWLAADADARLPTDTGLADGFSCDASGCIAQLDSGKLLSVIKRADAAEEDCRRAAIVVTTRDIPADCAATVIDRAMRRSGGALALYRSGDGWQVTAARSPGEDRPWAKASAPKTVAGEPWPRARRRAAPKDATPRTDDLGPDDAGAIERPEAANNGR